MMIGLSVMIKPPHTEAYTCPPSIQSAPKITVYFKATYITYPIYAAVSFRKHGMKQKLLQNLKAVHSFSLLK